MATSNALALRPKARLPKPAYLHVNDDVWDILTSSTFPTARDPNMIALAWQVCQIRKLDIFRKPFHITSMWSAAAGREVEQLMPGINELLVTATRTGEFAGNDPPIHGKAVTETFRGRRRARGRDRDRDSWEDYEVTLTYPETTEVVVYRFVKGQRCAFSMPVRWREEYQRVGGTALPNDMWARRIYDQCQKVALAASLRVAFSDVVEPESEPIDVTQQPVEIIENEPQRAAPPSKGLPEPEPPPQPKTEPPMDPETGEVGPHTIAFLNDDESWQQWGARFIAAVNAAEAEAEIDKWIEANKDSLDKFAAEAPKMYARLDAGLNKRRNELKMAQAPKGEST